jgi:hypothetical protein
MRSRGLSSSLWLAPLVLVAALAGCEVDSFLTCGAPCDPDAAARRDAGEAPARDASGASEPFDATSNDGWVSPAADGAGPDGSEAGLVADGRAPREGSLDDDSGSEDDDGQARDDAGDAACRSSGATCASTERCCQGSCTNSKCVDN